MAHLEIFSHSLRVLIVEDSKTDAKLTEKALAGALPNAYCTVAETLEVAVQNIKGNEFDVILLDLGLPDTLELSGLLTIQNLAPKIPVIILTSQTNEDLALLAVKGGAQDYLFKREANDHTIKRAIQYAIQRKQFESALTEQANFDALTGLANRNLYENRLDIALARCRRTSKGVGVLFLDLDHFKQVNDTYGHHIGDDLLRQVAIRVKQSMRPYDIVARFGGDELALLIEDLVHSNDCEVVAKKIIQKFAEPFIIADTNIKVGVSIGIATCLATENLNREALLRYADEAMYCAKLHFGSHYKIYNDEGFEKISTTSKLEMHSQLR